MSWKMHGTDEVFAALRSLCSNAYRMYDPCEHRSYYDHECDAYECVVEDAAKEYERLLRHCNHQREQLVRYEQKEGNMGNIDGGTEIERIRSSSITDELREFMERADGYELWCPHHKVELTRIADRIDEEYERARNAAYETGFSDGEDADEHDGWMKLPVDADGVPIRVGDVMEERSGHTFEVASLMVFGGSDNWLVLSDARNFSSFREPHDLRHVQPDSWESIIQDAVKLGYADYPTTSYEAELVERCRRLAGEAE